MRNNPVPATARRVQEAPIVYELNQTAHGLQSKQTIVPEPAPQALPLVAEGQPPPITNYNPDVLTCLANLSNDEVFTQPDLVNHMLDLQTRLNHIFTRQLYGIAITELTSLLARRSVYCAKKANSPYSICTAFTTEQGNILYDRTEHTWHNGKCSYCGASQAEYDRDAGLESHAYQFIHTDQPQNLFGAEMKFDVIIGNPPYQLNDGGFGRSASPLYHKFVNQAKKLNPKHLVMIIPDRWFAGGKGLDGFRIEMLNDKRMKSLIDYTSANDLFPGADVPGGICFFNWEKDYFGNCEVTICNKGKSLSNYRDLAQFNTFIRDFESVQIVNKIKYQETLFMNEVVSSRKPFGLATNQKPKPSGDLTLIFNGGKGYFHKSDITVGIEMIEKWKVITSKTSYDHAGQPDKEGKRRVLSKIEILPPHTICTETYIVTGVFKSESEAINLFGYLHTKFSRFLISLLSFSQDITKDRFALVPVQDFKENWTDEKLYLKYGLTPEEIAFIESMIRPMELAGVGDA